MNATPSVLPLGTSRACVWTNYCPAALAGFGLGDGGAKGREDQCAHYYDPDPKNGITRQRGVPAGAKLPRAGRLTRDSRCTVAPTPSACMQHLLGSHPNGGLAGTERSPVLIGGVDPRGRMRAMRGRDASGKMVYQAASRGQWAPRYRGRSKRGIRARTCWRHHFIGAAKHRSPAGKCKAAELTRRP